MYLDFQNQKQQRMNRGKEEDIKWIVDLSKTICQVNITEEEISKAFRLGKLNEQKDWQLLINGEEQKR